MEKALSNKPRGFSAIEVVYNNIDIYAQAYKQYEKIEYIECRYLLILN